jgi:hypothetical protein
MAHGFGSFFGPHGAMRLQEEWLGGSVRGQRGSPDEQQGTIQAVFYVACFIELRAEPGSAFPQNE